MHISALTDIKQQTRTMRSSPPLMSVMYWEFRRFFASRLLWLQILVFFSLLLLIIWAMHMPAQFGRPAGPGHEALSGFIAGTSAWGLLTNLPSASMTLLILLVPFITADGVTRDTQRRTHELLLTTPLPTRAYVWGRYLTGVLLCLGLAVLLLVAILGMGLLLHLTIPDYPLPPLEVVLILWIGMVLPATVLVGSLSFAFGTLLPRLSNAVKFVILGGWIVGTVIIPIGLSNRVPPAWYVNWDPTSAVTALGLRSAYSFNLSTITSAAQLQPYLLSIENKMPDITGWFAPHLFLGASSLLLVLVTALAFKRSRTTVS